MSIIKSNKSWFRQLSYDIVKKQSVEFKDQMKPIHAVAVDDELGFIVSK